MTLSDGFLAHVSCWLPDDAGVSLHLPLPPIPSRESRKTGTSPDSRPQCASLLFIRKGA